MVYSNPSDSLRDFLERQEQFQVKETIRAHQELLAALSKYGDGPEWEELRQLLLNSDPGLFVVYEQGTHETEQPFNVVERIAEIEAEIEVIRGRKPTPRGYTISADYVRDLLLELKDLKG